MLFLPCSGLSSSSGPSPCVPRQGSVHLIQGRPLLRAGLWALQGFHAPEGGGWGASLPRSGMCALRAPVRLYTSHAGQTVAARCLGGRRCSPCPGSSLLATRPACQRLCAGQPMAPMNARTVMGACGACVGAPTLHGFCIPCPAFAYPAQLLHTLHGLCRNLCVLGAAPGHSTGLPDPCYLTCWRRRCLHRRLRSPAVTAAAAAAAALRREREPYRLRAVGHSLGGMSLLMHAVVAASQGRPSRIHRLILFTPAGVHAQMPRVGGCVRVH